MQIAVEIPDGVVEALKAGDVATSIFRATSLTTDLPDFYNAPSSLRVFETFLGSLVCPAFRRT